MLKRLIRTDDGVGIVTALAVSFIVFALGATWYSLSVHELDEVTFDRHRTAAINAAEAGAREVMHLLAEDVTRSGDPSGFRTMADLSSADFGTDGSGECEVETLQTADGDDAGEYWARATKTGDRKYLIEAWGWGPDTSSRQVVNKKVSFEVELVPLGGFRHALFAADGGLQAGNRKEIYGDAFSGSNMVISNYTRVFRNDPGYPGIGNVTVAKDLIITSGSNPQIDGSVFVNGYIQDDKVGTNYLADVVARHSNPASPYTKSYFRKATIGGTLYFRTATGSLQAGSNVTGTVVYNANAYDQPFPNIALPAFTWNPSEYGPIGGVPSLAAVGSNTWPSWASFQTWYSANKTNLRGAHYVNGGGTLDLGGAYLTNHFLLATSDNLTLKGTAAGAAPALAPATVTLVVDNPNKRLTIAQSSNSIPNTVHHLIVSEGEFDASQQTTIYGSIYGKKDISQQRLEIHFRPPVDAITTGFTFDPNLADKFIPQPGVWREVGVSDPVSLSTYCTIPS